MASEPYIVALFRAADQFGQLALGLADGNVHGCYLWKNRYGGIMDHLLVQNNGCGAG